MFNFEEWLKFVKHGFIRKIGPKFHRPPCPPRDISGSGPLNEQPPFGDLMRISEFAECVVRDTFNDNDGHGYWATEKWYRGSLKHGTQVYPSTFKDAINNQTKPKWATHVLWMNK